MHATGQRCKLNLATSNVGCLNIFLFEVHYINDIAMAISLMNIEQGVFVRVISYIYAVSRSPQ